jgi:hypothetical protein
LLPRSGITNYELLLCSCRVFDFSAVEETKVRNNGLSV